MLAFIKENKIIINSEILTNEKSELLEFIEDIESKKLKAIKLYDVKGDVCGIAFEKE